METSTRKRTSEVPEKASGPDAVARTPPPSTAIATRKHLRHTTLDDGSGIVEAEVGPKGTRSALLTRREATNRRRRRKQWLIGIALVLALFPPMWAVYLIGWLVWRSRPRQKSMRRVRKSIRALKKNQKGVALRQLQEAHLHDPSNNDALYWLGLLLSRQNRHEEAAEALTLVSDRVPGVPEVEAALVDACLANNQPDEAIYHAQQLFDAAPYSSEALLKLADAFEAAGRIELAIESLEQAPLHKRTLTKDLMRIHYRLGDLYEGRGDREKALHHFKRVFARDISFRDVQKRVSRLEESKDLE